MPMGGAGMTESSMFQHQTPEGVELTPTGKEKKKKPSKKKKDKLVGFDLYDSLFLSRARDSMKGLVRPSDSWSTSAC